MAQKVAGSRHVSGGFSQGQEKVLQPDDVSVPLGRGPARRQHVRFYRRGHLRPLSGDAGLRRV